MVQWDAAIENYQQFLGAPSIRGSRSGDVVITGLEKLDKDKVRSAADKLRKFTNKCEPVSDWSPADLPDDYAKQILDSGHAWRPSHDSGGWHWWRATLLFRHEYACTYCRRHAFDVLAEEGRVPRFEIEHTTPQSDSKGDHLRADRLENLTMACRSCNLIKGKRDEHHFVLELLSHARAVGKSESVLLKYLEPRDT